jgi:imidazolonepropionase
MKGFNNISQLVTLAGVHNKDGRKLAEDDLSIIEDGAILFDHDEIVWVGKTKEVPGEYKDFNFKCGKGLTITPEVVDSHTHLVFGGNRAREYSMRLNGADYQKIAEAGGGILSTMKQTNESSAEELFHLAKDRVERICSYGVGTIEVKTGYGLNIDKEIECAKVIKRLKEHFTPSVNIVSTFMPAHAIPKGFSNGQEYLRDVVYPAFERALKLDLFDCADIFFEEGYFNKNDTEEFFKYCQKNSIPIKVHADEFNDNGGAILACEYNAISCDHLLRTGSDGIRALSQSKTVATILPGTGFFLGKPQANARDLLDNGAKLAMASDYNPGSCHCDNLLMIAAIAAPTLKITLVELWASITYNAAHALNLTNQGAIVPGMKPRFSFFQVPQVDEITYNWGRNFAISEP